MSLGGETLSFVGHQEERKTEMAKLCVTMNRFAIVDQVLRGSAADVEVLFRQLFPAVKRIGKPVAGRAFWRAPAGQGMWPNLHDVVRWLDSLDDSDEKAEEVKFLHKLYITAKARVSPEVLAELESGREQNALV